MFTKLDPILNRRIQFTFSHLIWFKMYLNSTSFTYVGLFHACYTPNQCCGWNRLNNQFINVLIIIEEHWIKVNAPPVRKCQAIKTYVGMVVWLHTYLKYEYGKSPLHYLLAKRGWALKALWTLNRRKFLLPGRILVAMRTGLRISQGNSCSKHPLEPLPEF